MASVRRGDRSAASQPRVRSSAAKALRRDDAGDATKQLQRWVVDANGNISNFDMKALRNDILARLQTGANLYTLEECRMLIVHMTRVATQWQEKELAQLMYLTELTTKVLPGRQVVYQFPPSAPPPIPFCTAHSQMHDNPLFKITKVVEELNRSIVRMIDELWCNRRERLLLAARMLRDLEEAIPDAN